MKLFSESRPSVKEVGYNASGERGEMELKELTKVEIAEPCRRPVICTAG